MAQRLAPAEESSALRDRLRAGERLVGTVVTVPGAVLAELTASALDFVWIDLEHGAIGIGDVAPLAVAARAGGAASLVRLANASERALGAALDAGVAGVVAPRVESAGQAARLVDALRYPPRGSRGLAARRASAYAGAGKRPSGDPLCLVQLESARGLAGAREIAAVEGVDALVAGCGDLALALGADSVTAKPVRDAVAAVQGAAEAAGIASGVAGPDDPELLAELAAGRSAVLVLGADLRLYARALRAGVDRLRDPRRATDAPERREAHVGA